MRVTKMLTEKVIFVFIFFGLAFVEERFMRSKRTCFCFPQTVICYLLSVPQKKTFLETVILLYCNAWGVINGSSAHRNLDGIYTDYFWVARAQEIFGGNLV